MDKKTIFILTVSAILYLAYVLVIPWLVATVGTGVAELLFNITSRDKQTLYWVLFGLTVLIRMLKD